MQWHCELGVVPKVERYTLYIRSHEKMRVLMLHKAAIRELMALAVFTRFV